LPSILPNPKFPLASLLKTVLIGDSIEALDAADPPATPKTEYAEPFANLLNAIAALAPICVLLIPPSLTEIMFDEFLVIVTSSTFIPVTELN
jgi:hypothetical protein